MIEIGHPLRYIKILSYTFIRYKPHIIRYPITDINITFSAGENLEIPQGIPRQVAVVPLANRLDPLEAEAWMVP